MQFVEDATFVTKEALSIRTVLNNAVKTYCNICVHMSLTGITGRAWFSYATTATQMPYFGTHLNMAV